MRVAIIDYGVGNLRSVEKAFHASGIDAKVTSDVGELSRADKLVLPGVGAFRACVSALAGRGFDQLVRKRVIDGTPLLGVCVGMQMLFEQSEEFGATDGLGFLRGNITRFSEALVVPQVGWNQVEWRSDHALTNGIASGEFFYFIHSYFCDGAEKEVVLGETNYGGNYPSVVAHGNVMGVQFHPEKSQSAGLRLLRNFAEANRF